MTSRRLLRVGEQVKRAIAEDLQRGDVGDALPLVVITEVQPSPDLRHARVFFVPFQKDADTEAVQAALQDVATSLSQRLGRKIRMKYTPRLRFVFDEAYVAGQEVEDVLRRVGPTLGANNTHGHEDD